MAEFASAVSTRSALSRETEWAAQVSSERYAAGPNTTPRSVKLFTGGLGSDMQVVTRVPCRDLGDMVVDYEWDEKTEVARIEYVAAQLDETWIEEGEDPKVVFKHQPLPVGEDYWENLFLWMRLEGHIK